MENLEARRIELEKREQELTEQLRKATGVLENAKGPAERKSANAKCDRIKQLREGVRQELYRVKETTRSKRDPDTGLPIS